MDQYFGGSDIRDICFDLKIDYDNLPGDDKIGKIRELITFCERNNRIKDLLDQCRDRRPELNWPTEPWLG